uniref:Poly [ADP-ribose] polymerase n=1 Tax=Monodelphis domestica TaxID=13616 RepID=F6TWC3_MONDO
MADPTVCDFLTRILCAHGGRMELRELLGHIELSETQVVEVLSEAGPERFMLLDQGPGTCPVVLATTSVRVCRRKVCEGQCEALHLCKLNLLDRILKKHSLFTLSKKELGVLLLQSDPFFLPDICKHYKGENRSDSCSKKTECQRLHICEHFTQGKCGFEHCNRSHNLMDTKALELLREHGLTDSIIMNIQDIYNQKHAKNKKFLSGRKGQSNQRKRESRSQSRNRYFFETQELAPSPSALVGTSHIPGPDKTTPAPLPSFEGKAKESRTTTLSKDCAQSVSVSPKTSKTQEGCQAGTNSNVSVTSHRESRFGNQDGTQLAASTSPPFSTDKGSTPVRSSRVERKINMFFGSEDDSFSGPDLITTSKSGVMPSHNCANAGDDFGNQKAYSSPGLPKTVHVQGKGSNPVVFSKYKQTANGKKEDSSCKSKDNQSTLANPQMAKTATSIGKLATPIPNHSVANVSSTVRSRTFWNTHEQQHNLNKLADESLACQTDALNLNSNIHFHLPYRWQLRIANNWKDFKDMEDIEKAYCDPNISHHSIDFQKMTFGYFSVRRLSTPSTIQKPDYALSTEWLWYWKDELDQWIEYGKEVCVHFLPDNTGKPRKMIQTNILYHTKREVRRRPKFVNILEASVPLTVVPLSCQNAFLIGFFFLFFFKLLEVSRMSNEYVVIDFRFKSTMKNFEIQKIMRNQNPSLWNKFQRFVEKILFHATDQTRITSICTFSFDYSYQSLHEAKYGKGIYFAKEASSSHNNHKSSAKKKIMFVAQVLVGIMAEGKETHRPPELTIVDNINNPSIFVIFDSHQVYPEYVIEYTDIDKACSIS